MPFGSGPGRLLGYPHLTVATTPRAVALAVAAAVAVAVAVGIVAAVALLGRRWGR